MMDIFPRAYGKHNDASQDAGGGQIPKKWCIDRNQSQFFTSFFSLKRQWEQFDEESGEKRPILFVVGNHLRGNYLVNVQTRPSD